MAAGKFNYYLKLILACDLSLLSFFEFAPANYQNESEKTVLRLDLKYRK